jgi:hypothetical protein
MNIYVNESNGDVYALKSKNTLNVLFDILSKDNGKEPTVIPLLATKPLKGISKDDYVIKVLRKYEDDPKSVTIKELNTLNNLGYSHLINLINTVV